jgi:hypothetical protein
MFIRRKNNVPCRKLLIIYFVVFIVTRENKFGDMTFMKFIFFLFCALYLTSVQAQEPINDVEMQSQMLKLKKHIVVLQII